MILAAAFCIWGVILSPALSQAPPKRCCTVDRWEGYFWLTEGNVINGSMSVIKERAFYSYDARRRRYAVKETVETAGNITYHLKVIADYEKNKMYSIDEESSTCVSLPLADPFTPACIPKGATFLDSKYYGGPKDKLVYDKWGLQIKSGNTKINGTITVTKNDCFPIAGEFTETETNSGDTASMMISIGFGGLTYGTKDPSIFKPPSDCQPLPAIKKGIFSKHLLYKYAMATTSLYTKSSHPMPFF